MLVSIFSIVGAKTLSAVSVTSSFARYDCPLNVIIKNIIILLYCMSNDIYMHLKRSHVACSNNSIWARIFFLASVVLKVVKNKYHRNNLAFVIFTILIVTSKSP